MNCTKSDSPAVDASKLSRQGMMKIFMSIDRTLVRESQRYEQASNLTELDQVMTELMRADIPDADIDTIARGNQTLIIPGEVTKEVNVMTGKVLQKNAIAARSVSSLPEKTKVESALKVFNGVGAKTFVYSFIPENSDLLKKYPEVKRKRAIQIQAINEVASEISFPVEYLKKHIRNSIVESYQTNPEQILHDIANGKDNEVQQVLLQANGLSGGFDPSLIASIAQGVGSLVTAFKGSNAPAKADYPAPVQQQQSSQPQVIVIPPQQNVTKDPAYEKEKDNTGLYIGLAVGGVALLGGAIVLARG